MNNGILRVRGMNEVGMQEFIKRRNRCSSSVLQEVLTHVPVKLFLARVISPNLAISAIPAEI